MTVETIPTTRELSHHSNEDQVRIVNGVAQDHLAMEVAKELAASGKTVHQTDIHNKILSRLNNPNKDVLWTYADVASQTTPTAVTQALDSSAKEEKASLGDIMQGIKGAGKDSSILNPTSEPLAKQAAEYLGLSQEEKQPVAQPNILEQKIAIDEPQFVIGASDPLGFDSPLEEPVLVTETESAIELGSKEDLDNEPSDNKNPRLFAHIRLKGLNPLQESVVGITAKPQHQQGFKLSGRNPADRIFSKSYNSAA